MVFKKRKRKKLIRNLLTTITLVTNLFIIAGVSRHWRVTQKSGKPTPVLLLPPNARYR